MSKIKNLIKFSAIQLKEFLSSFDVIFSDIDGEWTSVGKISIKIDDVSC